MKFNIKKKFTMKEPPLGSVVIDRTGAAWQRVPNGWAIAGTDGSWFYAWEQVIAETSNNQYVYPEHFLDDPIIVYVPNEELICNCGEDLDSEDC